MKRLWYMAVFAGGLLGVAVALAGTAPEPETAPITWELDFQPLGVVCPIRIVLPGDEQATTFWYLRYRIINDTGDDRQFIPSFDLATDTGQLFNSRTPIPRVVYEEIKSLHNQPLLTNVAGVAGKILQGEDNAKDGVAIWPDFDPAAGSVDIFVGGLSGEEETVTLPSPLTATVVNAAGEEVTVTIDEVVLQKTLQLTYTVPGEADARFTTPASLADENWVMR
ncbi:MAG: hypothetical protein ACYTFO_01985 [Planctomycetota bacterium]|jgi:hypothetical protein